MSILEIKFGKTFHESEVLIDGARIPAHEARLIVSGGALTCVEVEVVTSTPDGGRKIELIRKRISEPVEVAVAIPDNSGARLLEEIE